MIRMRFLPATLALLLGFAAPLLAQDQPPLDVPDDLKLFWGQYQPAHEADDEPAMDKAVRQHQDLAEQTLDLFLDDISRKERPEMHDDLRALARSLDRVAGQPQYMTRVRFVLNLSPGERLSRHGLMQELNKAFDGYAVAAEERSEEAWESSLKDFSHSAQSLEELGDIQFTIIALRKMSDIQLLLKRPWDRSQSLKHLVEVGAGLDYKDAEVESARNMLAELKAKGIDPDGPRPGDVPDDAGATSADTDAPSGPGRGLTSFREGSTELPFTLVQDAPKKGLGSLQFPGPFPLDNYYLWPTTWMKDNGPEEINLGGPTLFQPFGKPLALSRDGAAFMIDCTGDGKPDVTFTPNTTPQRVELPSPDGKSSFPIMVCIPGDKESMFGLELNFSPQPTGARLRVNVASSMDGKVLDDTWKLMDTNLTGVYGDLQDWWGDSITKGTDANPVRFEQPDSVLIGKARAAIPWSTVLPVGEDFYRTTITPDGKSITVRPLNLETGFVKLDMNTPVQPASIILREVGKLEGAYLEVAPAKKGGSVKVPVGTWQFVSGRIEKGAKTSMQQVRIYRGQSAPIEVKPGETTTLLLGGPFHIQADTKLDGKQTVVDGLSLRVFGRSMEEYGTFFDDTLQPEIEARTADGKKFGKPVKMRRPDITAWSESKDPDRLTWFPLSQMIENTKAEKLQLRLTQKSQALLGGPFDSDWIP